jgi:hypothetical protein
VEVEVGMTCDTVVVFMAFSSVGLVEDQAG